MKEDEERFVLRWPECDLEKHDTMTVYYCNDNGHNATNMKLADLVPWSIPIKYEADAGNTGAFKSFLSLKLN